MGSAFEEDRIVRREEFRIQEREESTRARRRAKAERERERRIAAKKKLMVNRASMLISAGFHVDARDEYGHTMLIMAARFDNIALVELMVSKKATVDLRDTKGITALMWAARWGYLPIVRFLVEKGKAMVGPGVRKTTTTTSSSSSSFLVEKGKAMVGPGVRKTTTTTSSSSSSSTSSTGGISSSRDSHGLTPLMFAAREGQVDVVRYLVSAQASVNTSTIASGTTAVLMAARSNRLRVLDYLLREAGASLSADHEGVTPLIAASKRHFSNNSDGTVGYLLDRVEGVDVNETDNNRRTALMHASVLKHSHKLMQRLLEAKSIDTEECTGLALQAKTPEGEEEEDDEDFPRLEQAKLLQQHMDEVKVQVLNRDLERLHMLHGTVIKAMRHHQLKQGEEEENEVLDHRRHHH
eukprot:CAMPEP_0170199704 /NCGR_PEP_ID=MMETSP0040_2-20121228/69483_1 /TAXON_ID=641309 /ORGANISM="Lotharella oceanica, Strain CCMP622" /LENGTH=409 /DNA_ID=CAMNT_0010449845 /DNA_START=205 /DNA_END=1435 /DNA_ORIENTATION=-